MASFANLTGRNEVAATGLMPADVPGAKPAPVHHVPPTPREIRAQAVHRLQVGLFGLAGMLLLVSLANVIMDRAQLVEDEAANAPSSAASGSATPAKDPLADMGVAPELPAGENEPATTATPTIVIPSPTAPPAQP